VDESWENLDLKLDFDFYDYIFKFLVGSAHLVALALQGRRDLGGVDIIY